jgi:NADPH-dependent 2,4-dienoyl-CoA reductase/sulfur reductase-like enzyme/rhodanese-related sulfurtransferase
VSLHIVIIGAVALGPKAGCRIKRLDPSAQVTMLDKDSIISYGGCGIPYYVSGDVADLKGLTSTSFHMERNPDFFKGAKGVEVRNRTEALAISRNEKKVMIRDLESGEESQLDYDKLILATGSTPVMPPLPGMNLNRVMPVNDLHAAEAIKGLVSKGQVETAAVVGAGATGLEMAEALADLWGIEVHVIEAADRVLPAFLDSEFARMYENHLNQHEEIHLHLNSPLQEILDDGEGNACGVRFDGQEVACDLVLVATGVKPNSALAQTSGLAVDERGAILVDEYLRTNDPDIYAGGDCVALKHLVTGQRVCIASGSLANRMGRVIGSNVLGGAAKFPGVVGSFSIKVFGQALAHTGLNEEQAKAAGFDPVGPVVVQPDRAHFHPDQAMMYVKLVVDRPSRRVLGFTALGENGDAVVGRVNALAGPISQAARVEEISNLELAYCPPLGAALDIVNAAANTCENLIEGRLRPIKTREFSERLARGEEGGTVFLDLRTYENARPYLEAHAPYWTHLPQEALAGRLDEVPRDKEVILVCNSGARSYEAQCTLNNAGFDNTYNLAGGAAAVKKWGEPILPKDDDSE